MEIITKLPVDIRLHILPYTYRVQSKHLLRDIESYKECLRKNYLTILRQAKFELFVPFKRSTKSLL